MNQPESPQDLLHLQHILTRDLDALAQEVEVTPDGLLWQGVPGFPNAVGTLAFHLCGNLRHFIGHEIGGAVKPRCRNCLYISRDATCLSDALVFDGDVDKQTKFSYKVEKKSVRR